MTGRLTAVVLLTLAIPGILWAGGDEDRDDTSLDEDQFETMSYISSHGILAEHLNAAVRARYGDSPNVDEFWDAVCGFTNYVLDENDHGIRAFIKYEIEGENSLNRWKNRAKFAGLTVENRDHGAVIIVDDEDQYAEYIEAEVATAREFGISEAAISLIHDILWDYRERAISPHSGIPIPPEIDISGIKTINERACAIDDEHERAAFQRRILSALVTLVGATVVIIDATGMVPTAGAAAVSVPLGGLIAGAGMVPLTAPLLSGE